VVYCASLCSAAPSVAIHSVENSCVCQFERLGRAVYEADLEVLISDAYELADAAKSHERLAEGHALGKIVLMVRNAATLT
jgi:zinc-binding alcohol dehydrogenase family protein